ncbi:protein of unknown function [Kyrpidia spormannii]|uniref:Uncharacterized protein n=2 Tax=Kyrpidia spormannii TaxID=2055160 RepID=A0ACA8Z5B5_9BACL|nr:protein of unknown function [Kyrpidia spormannii]CAB3390424.1 protein of unknown function [Kyrpidia spormannii]
MPRKKYDTDFKTKVVLEILKEEKTLSQLASEYGVHVNHGALGCRVEGQYPSLRTRLGVECYSHQTRFYTSLETSKRSGEA